MAMPVVVSRNNNIIAIDWKLMVVCSAPLMGSSKLIDCLLDEFTPTLYAMVITTMRPASVRRPIGDMARLAHARGPLTGACRFHATLVVIQQGA